jgi:hypothetical protein
MKQPLRDEDLRHTHTPLGVDPEGQSASLRELRALENAGRSAMWLRNDRMLALALSGSVSRPDMARAIGVSPSRVDQIIAAHHKQLADQRTAALRERANRHLPPELWHTL